MLKRSDFWLLALAAVLLSRMIGMVLFPFVDTTEPRYAEIARLMAETGDWITPWFKPGTPFWGKPPLSFWSQALSIRLFGASEFALRLPAWIATIGIAWLTYRLAREFWGQRIAHWAVLVFATMALTYISAGAVMTDTFLVFGTSLSLISFALAVSGHGLYWRWLFFAGLVIGLLSKGPLALVLTGMPIGLWALTSKRLPQTLHALPWCRGILLTLALSAPWYILAELKTPGFIDYFIVGEHIKRFLDPGWAGDLYGSAHDQPKGMVWLFWVWASFPWGILALSGLAITAYRRRLGPTLARAFSDRPTLFLILCAATPMLFFSLAGNTLWTYVLPSLPFSAILIARWSSTFDSPAAKQGRNLALALVPVLVTVFVVLASYGLKPLKTEKRLVDTYQKQNSSTDSSLFYIDRVPFSARYYSRGEATAISESALTKRLQTRDGSTLYLAAPRDWSADRIDGIVGASREVMNNRRYRLWALEAPISGNQRQTGIVPDQLHDE